MGMRYPAPVENQGVQAGHTVEAPVRWVVLEAVPRATVGINSATSHTDVSCAGEMVCEGMEGTKRCRGPTRRPSVFV